ncbi:MAG: L,D-transpeptidase catalytic domain [Solirubrobacterales bacterium]|nr:L,D-transpeptidase catalytic domain [Solirubrobacterales bacterium]
MLPVLCALVLMRAGTSLRDPVGSARSHGCIRVPDRWISHLAGRVEPGAPVRIEA